MFKRYWLVELIAYNDVKSIRSNCVLEGGVLSLPPLDLIFENCNNNGFGSVNILSVTRISADCAKKIKNRICSYEKFKNENIKDIVSHLKTKVDVSNKTDNNK